MLYCGLRRKYQLQNQLLKNKDIIKITLPPILSIFRKFPKIDENRWQYLDYN